MIGPADPATEQNDDAPDCGGRSGRSPSTETVTKSDRSPQGLLEQGRRILDPVLAPHGFHFQPSAEEGSVVFASGRYARAEREIELEKIEEERRLRADMGSDLKRFLHRVFGLS